MTRWKSGGGGAEMSKRKSPEAAIQIAIIKWLRLVMPRAIIHHSVNEVNKRGTAGMINAARNKARGCMPGFPDLIVMPEANVGVYFLEVKNKGGYPTDVQKQVHEILRDRGYKVGVVRSIDDTRAFLQANAIGFREVTL